MALLHSAWYQQSLRRYHARGVLELALSSKKANKGEQW
jgi:hypothetical protein